MELRLRADITRYTSFGYAAPPTPTGPTDPTIPPSRAPTICPSPASLPAAPQPQPDRRRRRPGPRRHAAGAYGLQRSAPQVRVPPGSMCSSLGFRGSGRWQVQRERAVPKEAVDDTDPTDSFRVHSGGEAVPLNRRHTMISFRYRSEGYCRFGRRKKGHFGVLECRPALRARALMCLFARLSSCVCNDELRVRARMRE
jgi:hypothetical protein